MAIALLASSLTVSAAGANTTTSTAPTPPDLFVAYAPLVSSGSTLGADTAEAFNTSLISSSPTTASLGSAQVGAQPVAEVVSPDGGTVYVLNSASDSITPVSTLTTSPNPPQAGPTIPLPSGYLPMAMALSPDGADVYVVGEPAVSNTLTPAMWEISLTGSSPGTLVRTVLLPSNSSPAGIAIAPDSHEALITNYSGGNVIPVRLSDGKVGTAITVGAGPIGIGVAADGSDAYVANSSEGTLTQIDLSNNTATLPSTPLETGFSPQQVAVSPDGSTAWVTEDNIAVPGNAGFVVPVSIPTMIANAPIQVGYDPNGVAISPDGATVYVADETNGYGVGHTKGAISIINTADGSQTRLLTSIDPTAVVVTPDEAPVAAFVTHAAPTGHATCFDASTSYSLTAGGLTYAWNFGDGTVSPPPNAADGYNMTTCHPYVLPGTYHVTLAVTDVSGTSTNVVFTGQYVLNNGGPSAGMSADVTIADASTNRPPVAYVANAQSNSVTPILADPNQANAPNVAGSPIGVGVHPAAIAITPNGRTAYVVNFGSGNVTPIDTATNSAPPAAAWITVGSEPDAIAITPDGTTAYVANSGDGTVSKIALSTRQVQATITVGGSPTGIAISPDGSTAYVTDNAPGYNNVIPINLSNNAVQPSAPAGTDPVAIAITPDGHVAFVVDRGSNTVPGAVTPIDLTAVSLSPGAQTLVGNSPSSIAIAPDGGAAYVTNFADGTLSQIILTADVAGAVTTSNAGTNPSGVAVTPNGSGAYIADDQSSGVTAGTVSVLGLPTAAGVPTPISVGLAPDAVAITPDQAPIATLTVAPGAATQVTTFDASQSQFPSTPADFYTWNYGDGSSPDTTTVPTSTHVYDEGGAYTASVTITDTDGTSTTQHFTGQTVSLNGGPSAQASQVVNIPYFLPAVTGVSPSSGQAGQVTSLIITGTNFFGITTVNVGGNAVTGFTVNSTGTQISNVLAPAASAGSVDVTVTNPAGTSAITPLDVFTYLPTTTPPASAPTVTSLSQQWGPVGGGTGVTIEGTNFTGATSVQFGTVPATSFVVNAAGTEITAISPSASSAGTVDVTVTTPVATSDVTASDAFTYLAPPAPSSAPVVQSISPDTGPTSGLTSVTVTGLNFTGATQVYFGATPAQSFFVSGPTSLSAVSPAVPNASTVDITVVTPAGVSTIVPVDAYTYTDGSSSAGPVVTGVVPSSGPISGGNTVVINGSNFVNLSSSSVMFGASSATFSVNSAGTQIIATAPSASMAQSIDVVVSNPLGASTITSADVYTYQPDAQFAPVVSSISPSSGPIAGGATVTLTGTNLASVTSISFGTTSVGSFSVNGTGTAIFVSAPAAASAGTVSVTATGPYGTSDVTASDAYTYLPLNPPITGPQVTGLNPSVGPISGGTGVTITGTDFVNVTAVYFGSTPASSYTVDPSGTTIVATTPSAASAGSVDVTVVSSSDGTSPIAVGDVYTYLSGPAPAPPVITGVAPGSGPLTGGTVVTLTGTGFAGTMKVKFGTLQGTNISVNAAGTSITVTTPAALYATTVPVTVITTTAQSVASVIGQFTYTEVISSYHALAPFRALDTRLPGSGGYLGAGETRDLTLAGVDGVPVGATGVFVNLTITDTSASTFVTMFPTGATRPSVSNTIAARGQTVGHLVEVPLGAGGAVSIYNNAGSNHVVLDLEGYFTAGVSSSGGFVPIKPSLVLNTAAIHGGGPISSHLDRTIKLAGLGGVPKTGVSAVAFILSASSTTAKSYATVYPTGSSLPDASNENWLKGATASNLVISPIGPGGAIKIHNQAGVANFTITVIGYVTGAGSPIAGAFNTPTISSSFFDSSVSGSGGPLVAGHNRTVTIAGLGAVPSNASAVVLDVTVSTTSANSSLTIYAAGATKPTVPTVSWLKGQTTSIFVVVPIGSSGAIALSNQLGHANVAITVEGFFQS